MTREDFIERFRHQLVGLATDGALSERRGADFALWMRMRMKQIDQLCAEMYAAAQAEKAEPAKPAAAVIPMTGQQAHKRTTA